MDFFSNSLKVEEEQEGGVKLRGGGEGARGDGVQRDFAIAAAATLLTTNLLVLRLEKTIEFQVDDDK